MTTVFILFNGTYDDLYIQGVFSSMEKAIEYRDDNFEKKDCVRCEGTGKVAITEWNPKGICMVCDGCGCIYGDYVNIEEWLVD